MLNIISLFLLSFELFTPNLRLNSGKQVSLIGTGPPVIFSSGLFNTMPRHIYSNFVNNLKKNITVVSVDNFNTLTKNDIDDIADNLNVNYVSYISHSSFNSDILESDKINKAILVDPICIPKVNIFNTNNIDLGRICIDVKFPVMIFKSEKLYIGDKTLPEWQDPLINGVVTTELVNNIGHPDILDDNWADFAKNTNLWNTANGEKTDFKNWKFIKNNNIKEIRKNYWDYLANKILNFINTDNQDIAITPEIITNNITN